MSQLLTNKIIHLASDHAGFEYKQEIKNWLIGAGCRVVDHGATIFDEDDDFPDFIGLAARVVSLDPEGSCGVVFGGSGQGEAMLANRFANVRATVFCADNNEIIKLSREHNNANILSIGSRFVSLDSVKNALELWFLTTVSVDEKYQRRNQKIEKITKELRGL